MIRWLAAHDTTFPDTRDALGPDSEACGLLAAGGDLSVDRLRAAYRRGIFPWFARGQPPLWWSPDPRMVLQVADFKVSRSLRKTLQRFARDPGCEIRVDSAFRRVIEACSATPRPGQDDTWIVPEMIEAYTAWHRAGQVHSFECWMDGELAGGLYGVHLGRMFFGESMFAHRTDASKIALAALVAFCRGHGIPWIDCQQQTSHLASLGAAPVPRPVFEAHLRETVDAAGPKGWSYHPSMWRHVLPAPAAGAADDPAAT